MKLKSASKKFSICLYLNDQEMITIRNIRYLSDKLTRSEYPVFEVVVVYTANKNIAHLAKLYPNIRWHRMVRKPVNHFFLYRYFTKQVRSKILVFISSQILLSMRDAFNLANNALKENVLFSYLENSQYLFLPSHQKRLKDQFGYFLNRSRSELYINLNSPIKLSSIEFFAINLDLFNEALVRIGIREKFHFFRGRFMMKEYTSKKQVVCFDFCLGLLAFRSGMKIDSPGRASSRWLIPTSASFFPVFMFYKQIKILIKLMISTGYIPNMINYKKIFLFISHLALILFFIMSALGYRDSWLLFVFFVFLNSPLLIQSSHPFFRLYHMFKLFLLLL